MKHFVINLNPVSKKNSQRIITLRTKQNGVTRLRPCIVPSDVYKAYEKEALKQLPDLFINERVNVKAHFYRGDRRRVDMVNLQEALLDVLVKGGVLEDDNINIVAAMDGSRVFYDKKNPRTEVWIERI